MSRPFDLISFDFDGVLLHNNFNELILDACRALGLRWDAANEPRMIRFIHDYYGSGQADRERAEHGEERFWQIANRRFAEALGAEGLTDAMVPRMIERIRGAEPLFFHETGLHELLHRLRREGYRLAMITNRDDRIHHFGAEWRLTPHFEMIATRQTVGKPKPSPEVFYHVAVHFGVAGSRALHIGDNPYADVVGAQAAGWQALLLDPDGLFPDWEVPRLQSLHDLPTWLADRPTAGTPVATEP